MRFKLIYLFYLSSIFIQPVFASSINTSNICPASVKATQAAASNNAPILGSLTCQKIILQHFKRGETDWINIAPLLYQTGNASVSELIRYGLSMALVKNPHAVLGVLHTSFQDTALDFCHAPFIEDEVTPLQRRQFEEAAVNALKNMQPTKKLRILRQSCLHSFEDDLRHR